MNIFLKKIALLGSIFGLCLLCLNHLVFTSNKRYAGNPVYALKRDFLLQNQNQFNTVAIGSSLTYRHIIPEKLDSSLKACETSTFNLGADGLFNPETYYLYENLIDEIPDNSLDYAFVEIIGMPNIESENLATPRSFYWHNLQYWLFSTDYILDSNEPPAVKLEYLREYSVSYLYRLLLGFRVLFSSSPNEVQHLGQNGFYAFDTKMKNPKTDPETRDRLKGKNVALLKDTNVLQERIEIAKKTFSTTQDGSINQAHLRKLRQLLRKSQQKGIELVFFVPPRLHDYEGLASVVEKLPPDRVVEVFDPQKYPEFYQLNLSFDEVHLNEAGAEIFTQRFADAIDNVCANSHSADSSSVDNRLVE